MSLHCCTAEIGDGVVARAARQAQGEIFKAPILPSNTGVPSHARKLRRAKGQHAANAGPTR